MGKPRKVRSDNEGRSIVVSLKLTEAEREQWQSAAAKESISLSEWLRAAAELAIARGSTR